MYMNPVVPVKKQLDIYFYHGCKIFHVAPVFFGTVNKVDLGFYIKMLLQVIDLFLDKDPGIIIFMFRVHIGNVQDLHHSLFE